MRPGRDRVSAWYAQLSELQLEAMRAPHDTAALVERAERLKREISLSLATHRNEWLSRQPPSPESIRARRTADQLIDHINALIERSGSGAAKDAPPDQR